MLRTFFLFLAFSLLISEYGMSQAQLDPPRPVLTSRARSIEVNISNPSAQPMEVLINTEFTVIRTDSMGRIAIVGSDLDEQERSRDCSSWLKVFPRRLVLPGTSSRTVRILASIPQNAPEGEYWTRLNLDCTPMEAPAELPKLDSGDVALGVSMTSVLSTPVLVRVGTIATGMEISEVHGVLDSAQLTLVCDLKRMGNSPYRGTVMANVYGPDGTQVASSLAETTVEFMTRTPIVLPALSDGSYRVELAATSIRKGSMSEIVVPADEVKREYTMVVSGLTVSLSPTTN